MASSLLNKENKKYYNNDYPNVNIEDKRSEYVSRLEEARETLFGNDSISVCCKEKLANVTVFSVFHLLKDGIYDFVGASFYPEDEDLIGIKIEDQSPTATEFCEILPETPIAFENVVKTIVFKELRNSYSTFYDDDYDQIPLYLK
ncbi:hypothetical protein PIROE2DRAFT_8375 [Piromyces sp. E2]|nr:hypothetical protein PIROE2DRAFT_8375 [Piromyces sp. E2]|eukprot:OUM64763.1 hypothetical protein PIROE2DRAFT_8375 [Piromyces sp. E2]